MHNNRYLSKAHGILRAAKLDAKHYEKEIKFYREIINKNNDPKCLGTLLAQDMLNTCLEHYSVAMEAVSALQLLFEESSR